MLMPSGSKPTSPTIEPSSAGGFFRKGMAADRSIAITGDETACAGAVCGATVGAKPDTAENTDSCQGRGTGVGWSSWRHGSERADLEARRLPSKVWCRQAVRRL